MVYFKDIWYILVYFTPFWYVVPRKQSGNPESEPTPLNSSGYSTLPAEEYAARD
jgi:hypothetical protein